MTLKRKALTLVAKSLVYVCGFAATIVLSDNLIEALWVWIDHHNEKKANSRA